MMGEYATKTEDEEGKTRWASTDGKTYKTRSGAWKWSKKLEKGQEIQSPEPEEVKEVENPEPISSEPTTSGVEWASFDFSDEGDYPTETVPAVLKRIQPASAGGTKKTKKQAEAEQQTSMALLGVGYRSADVLLTKYKRAVLQDKDVEGVTHSDEDIDWISGITNDALVHSNIHIANAFSPVQIAAGANLYWFGKPLYVIQSQAKRNPFKGALSGVGRFIEYIPFVGKRIRARRLAAEEVDGDVREVIQA